MSRIKTSIFSGSGELIESIQDNRLFNHLFALCERSKSGEYVTMEFPVTTETMATIRRAVSLLESNRLQ